MSEPDLEEPPREEAVRTPSPPLSGLHLSDPAILATPPSAHSSTTSPNELDEPPEEPAAPTPFQFPSEQQAAARSAHNGQETILVGSSDGDGAFESVALDRHEGLSSNSSAGGWSRPGDDKHAASPLPTPPLSESQTTTPNETSSKLDVTPGGEAVEDTPKVVSGETEEQPTTPNLPAAIEPKASDVAEAKRKASVTPRGASLLQQHVSMTRQRDLPPKDKEQEKKHLKELEEMLAASKEAERRREIQLETAHTLRASVLAGALPAWETAILPNWRVVLRPTANGTSLRKLWWNGTMPVRWRGQLWGQCIGNSLALGKTAWTNSHGRAKAAVQDGQYPEHEMAALLEDVEATLPALKLFQKDGVMHDDLVDLLLAYTVYMPGEPRYPRGISYLAALLLVNMTMPDAFLALVNLVNKSFLKSFYSAQPEEEDAYYRIFDTLLADNMPKVYANFSHETVRPSLYLRPWLTTAFVNFLPIDVSTRIFDVFLLEGDSFLFRIALVLLQILEPRLFNPVLTELAEVFEGKDRGAVAVVRRQQGLLGETDDVPVDWVYEEMGCEEEAIFKKLGELEWKEETWDRLVARELPEAD